MHRRFCVNPESILTQSAFRGAIQPAGLKMVDPGCRAADSLTHPGPSESQFTASVNQKVIVDQATLSSRRQGRRNSIPGSLGVASRTPYGPRSFLCRFLNTKRLLHALSREIRRGNSGRYCIWSMRLDCPFPFQPRRRNKQPTYRPDRPMRIGTNWIAA